MTRRPIAADEAAAAFGEYFAIVGRDGDDWYPVAGLDGHALRELVTPTARAIAATDRVAASIWFLGVAARIVSPPFGIAALTATLPLPTADSVWLRGTGPIAADHETSCRGTPAELGTALHDHVVTRVLAPLIDLVGTEFSVSRKVLWGDVVSAVHGAQVVVGLVRPDLRPVADAIRRAALDGPLLTGRWTDTPDGFRRRSCCLLYRARSGGLCADCVLRR